MWCWINVKQDTLGKVQKIEKLIVLWDHLNQILHRDDNTGSRKLLFPDFLHKWYYSLNKSVQWCLPYHCTVYYHHSTVFYDNVSVFSRWFFVASYATVYFRTVVQTRWSYMNLYVNWLQLTLSVWMNYAHREIFESQQPAYHHHHHCLVPYHRVFSYLYRESFFFKFLPTLLPMTTSS